MAFDTYSELKEAIRRYSHKKNLLDEDIPSFIAITESRINRFLRVREMEAQLTDTTSSSFYDLPSDFIELIDLNIGDRVPLTQKTPQQLNLDRFSYEISYAISNNKIEIRPTVSDEIDIELQYYAKVSPLVNDSDTNSILTVYPMIYLYGAMIDVCIFTEDDSRISLFEESFTKEVQLANDSNGRSLHNGAPLTVRGN